MELPILVLISGNPGAGKSTLARHLAAEGALWLPLVACNPLRNGIRTTLTERGSIAAARPGKEAVDLFYDTITFCWHEKLVSSPSYRSDVGSMNCACPRYCRYVGYAISIARRSPLSHTSAFSLDSRCAALSMKLVLSSPPCLTEPSTGRCSGHSISRCRACSSTPPMAMTRHSKRSWHFVGSEVSPSTEGPQRSLWPLGSVFRKVR